MFITYLSSPGPEGHPRLGLSARLRDQPEFAYDFDGNHWTSNPDTNAESIREILSEPSGEYRHHHIVQFFHKVYLFGTQTIILTIHDLKSDRVRWEFVANVSDHVNLNDMTEGLMPKKGPSPTDGPGIRYADGFKWVGTTRIDPSVYYQSKSSNGVTKYLAIKWADGSTSCDCPGWANRKGCKHVKQVAGMTTSEFLPGEMPAHLSQPAQVSGQRGRGIALKKKG